LLSILEGVAYGCGDVILGLNPASDDVDTIIRLEQLLQSVVERLKLPTRFCVLSDIAELEYQCSDVYDGTSERGVRWDDPDLAIEWPVATPIISERDRKHPAFAELKLGAFTRRDQ
jgi:hypothetical protein